MIDHLVLATPDLVATSAAIARAWGVEVVAGGAHTGLGTRNALTGLGAGVYLEIVGPDPGQPPPRRPRPFGVDHLTQPTLVAWCARPAMPLADVVNRVASHGVHLGDIAEMSRARPDGVALHWRLTFPLLGPPHEGCVPFLIDWLDSSHPAESLPHQARLDALHLVHPQADVLNAVLAEIGHTRAIHVEQGPAQLWAEVHTPNGAVSL
ncbi:MAG: VOC family protein [Actinomycetota bacterium]|nr:VOC family protein [Actinomycetota bacterium]